jgi:hypothetical protein
MSMEGDADNYNYTFRDFLLASRVMGFISSNMRTHQTVYEGDVSYEDAKIIEANIAALQAARGIALNEAERLLRIEVE